MISISASMLVLSNWYAQKRGPNLRTRSRYMYAPSASAAGFVSEPELQDPFGRFLHQTLAGPAVRFQPRGLDLFPPRRLTRVGDVAKFPLRRPFAGNRNEPALFPGDHPEVMDDEFTVDGDGN